MKIYLAFDCSLPLILQSSTQPITEIKVQRAHQFMSGIVYKMSLEGIDIDLVEFSKEPKIVRRSPRVEQDIIESFPPSIIKSGTPNFLLLRDLILNENVLNDFELILLLEGSNYNWIPHSFRLPCPIYFILLTDLPNSVSPQLLSEIRLISVEFSSEEANPTIICKDEDVKMALDKIIKIPRLQEKATLYISEEHKINIEIIPGIPRLPIYSIDGHGQLSRILETTLDGIPAFKLVGFANSQSLFNVKSSPLAHCVRPTDNSHFFHCMAEVLGAEGMVAIFQQSLTGEEYALKPFRSDSAKLWVLCLQFLPSSKFKWDPVGRQIGSTTKKCQFPDISYKATAPPQIHWVDQHGIQSDMQKLHRLLKRTDRVDLFYQEIQRMSNNAVAFGYHNFAETFANILEARCVNIPAECKAHLVRTTELLRKGGFKLVSETKLIM